MSQIPYNATIYSYHETMFRSKEDPNKISSQIRKEHINGIPQVNKNEFRILSLLNSPRQKNWVLKLEWFKAS